MDEKNEIVNSKMDKMPPKAPPNLNRNADLFFNQHSNPKENTPLRPTRPDHTTIETKTSNIPEKSRHLPPPPKSQVEIFSKPILPNKPEEKPNVKKIPNRPLPSKENILKNIDIEKEKAELKHLEKIKREEDKLARLEKTKQIDKLKQEKKQQKIQERELQQQKRSEELQAAVLEKRHKQEQREKVILDLKRQSILEKQLKKEELKEKVSTQNEEASKTRNGVIKTYSKKLKQAMVDKTLDEFKYLTPHEISKKVPSFSKGYYSLSRKIWVSVFILISLATVGLFVMSLLNFLGMGSNQTGNVFINTSNISLSDYGPLSSGATLDQSVVISVPPATTENSYDYVACAIKFECLLDNGEDASNLILFDFDYDNVFNKTALTSKEGVYKITNNEIIYFNFILLPGTAKEVINYIKVGSEISDYASRSITLKITFYGVLPVASKIKHENSYLKDAPNDWIYLIEQKALLYQ